MSANSAVAVRTIEAGPGLKTQGEAVRWFPMKPMEAILLRHLQGQGKGLKGWCEEKGLPLRAIQRARERGRIGWVLADEIACAMGLHPAVIWEEWCR